MTTTTASKRQPPARHLKSPLATARQAPSEREETLEEFADCLRTITNRDGRPAEASYMRAP
jgi:hypothetical protein